MRFISPSRSLHRLGFCFIGLLSLAALPASAQQQPLPYSWTTLAGARSGAGYNDGAASSALFDLPRTVAVSGSTVYVADSGNNIIRAITVSQSGTTVTTLAGQTNVTGTTDGLASVATFNTPTGIAVDGSGNLYVADSLNNSIRKITFTGTGTFVSTFAGLSGTSATPPPPVDGIGSTARFYGPTDVAVDSAGNVYVADSGNHAIRKITPASVVTTLAGLPGVSGVADGTGSAARFFDPIGLTVDGSGNVYVADSGNDIIRKISPDGYTITIAGTPGHPGHGDGASSAAQFYFPTGVVTDTNGNVYVADYGNNTVRLVSAGSVSTLAGTPGVSGSTGNFFNRPSGIALSNTSLFIADSSNQTIREMGIDGSNLITFAGNAPAGGFTDGPSGIAKFNRPNGVTLDGTGDVIVADTLNDTIREVLVSGSVITIAGVPGVSGTTDGDGNTVTGATVVTGTTIVSGTIVSTSTTALFNQPSGVVATGSTTFFVTDTGNNTIRMLTLSGSIWTVTTVAGSAGVTGTNDAIGTSAQFDAPTGIATDGQGTLYVADTGNQTIRYLDTTIFSVTTVPDVFINQPVGITIDAFGTIYVTDAATGDIDETDINGGFDFFDTFASGFNSPQGIAVDVNDNLYVADTLDTVITQIDQAGDQTVIGGTTGVFANVDGIGSAARFYAPTGIAVDSSSTASIYVADTGNNRIVKGTPLPLVNLVLNSTGVTLTSTSQVGFGVLPVRTASQQSFTITNYGITNLSGLSLAITGSQSSNFVVTPLAATTLGSGSSTSFTVTLTPTLAGTRSATLSVGSNDPIMPLISVLLTGTGVDNAQPVISVQDQSGNVLNTPANLSLENAIVGGFNQSKVNVSNLGLGPLQFLSFNITGADASDFTVSEPANLTVPAGQSTAFELFFAPKAAGPRSAILHVTSTDPVTPSFNFLLSGTGLSLTGQTGNFVGLLDNNAGMISITLASNGVFTGKIILNGTSSPIIGQMVPNTGNGPSVGFGQAQVGFPGYTVNLQMDLTGSSGNPNGTSIQGTAGSNGQFSFTAYRAAAAKSMPATAYNVLMNSTDGAAGVPAGTSYGVARVATSGKTSFVGKLADGTPFTFSAPLLGTPGNFQLIVFNSSSRYQLSGPLTFGTMTSGTAVIPVCTGPLFWNRDPVTSKPFVAYPAGFNTSLDAEGAAYSAKLKLKLNPTSVVLTDGTGGTIVPPHVSLKFTSASGLFNGSFTLPVPGRPKSVTFSGLLNPFDAETLAPRAEGFFIAPYVSGTAITTSTYSGEVSVTPTH